MKINRVRLHILPGRARSKRFVKISEEDYYLFNKPFISKDCLLQIRQSRETQAEYFLIKRGSKEMGENELRQACLKLMETVDVAYLSTIDSNGFPHTRIMSNLRDKKQHPNLAGVFEQHKEDFLIYMITSSSSAKMKQIRANPKVSVYFSVYTEVPSDFQYLMLGGEIEEISDQQLKKQLWQTGWEIFWHGGVDDPEYTVLRLIPDFARGGYQESPFEFELSGRK